MTGALGNGEGGWRFDGLRALYVNCTLKRSPSAATPRG